MGLTTALAILRGGWVVVGSLPTKDGIGGHRVRRLPDRSRQQGQVRETISGHGINGPWDMTAVSHGPFAELFVTNVLNGTVAAAATVVHRGTVLRLVLHVGGSASRRGWSTPPRSAPGSRSGPTRRHWSSAPTGVGLGPNGTLYVADSVRTGSPRSRMRPGASTSAGTGTMVTTGGKLNTPLGLAIAPNGDVLTVNGGNGLIVETTPAGKQVAKQLLDTSGSPPGAGALFGLAVAPQNARRLLRGRRGQHAAPAPLTSRTAGRAAGPVTTGRRQGATAARAGVDNAYGPTPAVWRGPYRSGSACCDTPASAF